MAMKIKISELKRFVLEALVDHMRLPRGENSRDDAEDRDLDDPAREGAFNIEELDEAFMDSYKEPTPGRRSVSPDVDAEPSYGGILTPEQVMTMWPKAAKVWINLMRNLHGELKRWSPRDLIDSMQFRVDGATLYADPKDENHRIDFLASIWRWDDEYGWESLS